MFVAYDQLSDRIGPLSRLDPARSGIVVCENSWKAAQRPYHRQKLALVLTSMRHFALGELFTTKPYESGAAYIDKMGDDCAACAFDPK